MVKVSEMVGEKTRTALGDRWACLMWCARGYAARRAPDRRACPCRRARGNHGGVKIPLGLWSGPAENATLARSLLADLVDRGLDSGGRSCSCSTAARGWTRYGNSARHFNLIEP